VSCSITTPGAGGPQSTAAKLRTGIVVTSAPLLLNADVPGTMVSGSITVNGAALPQANGYGNVYLGNAAGDVVALASTVTGTYSKLIVPGTYDVYYGLNTPGAGAPHNYAAKLRTGIVVTSSAHVRDGDVPGSMASA